MATSQRRSTFSEIFEMSNLTGSAYRILVRRRFKEAQIDLTVEMLQVLDCLWQKDNQSQQELADALLKDKVSMTYLINNLSKRQLVKRCDTDADKRVKLIQLTPEGVAMQDQAQNILIELRSLVIGDIPVEKMKVVLEYYSQFRRNIQAELDK